MIRTAISVTLIVGMLSSQVLAYGDRGHQLVGAIADRRLKDNAAIHNKIDELLDQLDLETVAVFPDQIIKSIDRSTPDHVFSRFPHVSDRLRQELTDFWEANHDRPLPSPAENRHRMAHYTDVPLQGAPKYQTGGKGQTEFDIVHAIPRCIRILKGRPTPEDEDRKITPSVALILLAHYVGDIHQPLHVGAEYFDSTGQPVDPANDLNALSDTGGNDIHFRFVPRHGARAHNLHAYWDEDAVDEAFPDDDDDANAANLAGNEPAGWKLADDIGIEGWAEAWANEILPVAAKAHPAMSFQGIVLGEEGKHIFDIQLNSNTYPKFAGNAVNTAIHKAGWRLAAVLEDVLQ
jgi:hypothetical protein